MGVTTPCCGLSGTKFHFKFRWCDRSKKFILADAFCQGCAGKNDESRAFPHQTTSFFNIKNKLRFRTPKPDLFTCLMIFVMYIIMPEFHASSQPGQHVRISKDRFTETVFLKNSNQVPAIVMVHFIVIIFLVHFMWHHNLSFGRRIQIPESRFQIPEYFPCARPLFLPRARMREQGVM